MTAGQRRNNMQYIRNLQEKKINICLTILEEVLAAKYGFKIIEDGFNQTEPFRLVWGCRRLGDFLSDEEILGDLLPDVEKNHVNTEITNSLFEHGFVSSTEDFMDYCYHFLCFLSKQGEEEISMEVFLLLANPHESVCLESFRKKSFSTPEAVIEQCSDYLSVHHEKGNFSARMATPPFITRTIGLLDTLLSPALLASSLPGRLLEGRHHGIDEDFDWWGLFGDDIWGCPKEFLPYFARESGKNGKKCLNCSGLPAEIPYIGIVNDFDAGDVMQFAVCLKDYLPREKIAELDRRYNNRYPQLYIKSAGEMALAVNIEAILTDALTIQYGFALPDEPVRYAPGAARDYSFDEINADWKEMLRTLDTEEDSELLRFCPVFDSDVISKSGVEVVENKHFPNRICYPYENYTSPSFYDEDVAEDEKDYFIHEAVKPYLKAALAADAIEKAAEEFLEFAISD